MKTITLVLFVLLVYFYSTFSFAACWTVCSQPGNNGADFSTLQNAHNSSKVSNGDTLYVIGFGASLGDITLTKRLNVIGPGYFLSENPNTQANMFPANTGDITFNIGSSGSSITSLSTNRINVYDSFISIRRSDIKVWLKLGDNVHDIIISQNYFDDLDNNGSRLYTGQNISNILVFNNYFGYGINQYTYQNKNSNLIISNNIIQGDIYVSDSVMKNNIILNASYFGSRNILMNNFIMNNVNNSDQFSTENANKIFYDKNNIFIGSGSTDGKWKLKNDSAAINAGTDGKDVGMFGGSSPYVLSGMPPIPSIYFFDAPVSASSAQGLQIHIKIKSNK